MAAHAVSSSGEEDVVMVASPQPSATVDAQGTSAPPQPSPSSERTTTVTPVSTTAPTPAPTLLPTPTLTPEVPTRPPPPRPSQQSPAEFPIKSTLEVVRSKWQMASVAHFIETFRAVLPFKEVSEDTAADITPDVLEVAVAQPELNARARVMLRDVIMALLLAVDAVSAKSAAAQWFPALRVLVEGNRTEFEQCIAADGSNKLEGYDSGMHFLTSVEWPVRLGVLLALCDMAAEVSEAVRDAIRAGEAEANSGGKAGAIEARGIRLEPLGRCSLRRTHYKVGKTRIYSGYRQKGGGDVVVECSDSATMKQFAEALSGSEVERDQRLGRQIRDEFVAPLEELELRLKRKMDRERQAEIEREESRRRNAHRPRRAKASYYDK